MQYQYWVYDANADPAWSQLQGYSASATCTWTPAAAGDYLLSVTALDSTTDTGANTTFWYTIGTPLSAVVLTPSLPAPQPANTPITLTAAATGGTNVQYQFWVYNANASPAWSQLQGYSASPTCTWTPADAGNYLLSATALDGASGTAVNDLLWYAITGGSLTAVSVSAAPASPQPVDTPITFTAAATGGTSVQYQFWVYNANANPAWSQLQGYSTSATCTWTPATPGDYLLSTTALDADGTAVNDLLWYTVNAALTLSVTAAPLSPQPVNTTVTLTAAATGGTSVQYQFWLYNANANPAWSQLQGYSASGTCTWTPAAPGNYLFSVTALDADGTAVNDLLWYTVNAAPELSVTPSLASPQYAGTPITFTVNNSSPLGTTTQYQFWVYNANANPAWSQLQGYSASASCTWTPATAGSYLISVTAQDSPSGTQYNQLLWYTIIAGQVNFADYWPMAVGDQWYYTDGTQQSSQVADAQVTLGSQPAIQVESLAGNELNGDSYYWNASTQFYAFGNDEGTSTYRFSPPLSFSQLTPAQPVTFSGNWLVNGAGTGNYTFTLTMQGMGSVTVPAGTFNDCLIVQVFKTVPGKNDDPEQVWFAKGVGQVQQLDLNNGYTQMLTGAMIGGQSYGSVPQLTGVSLSATPATQQFVNMPVTFTASATAGVFAQYQFWIYNANANPAWSQLQGYSTSPTCTWTPTAPGSYLISATAQDFTGAVVNQTLWYTVNTPSADENAILALFAALQTAADTHSVNGMLACFSPDYLQGGTDYAQVQANMEQGLSAVQSATATITNIAIDGNTAQVTANITVAFNNGQPTQSWTEPSTTQTISFGWLIKTNGQWLFYGDQQRALVQVGVGNYIDPNTGGNFSVQMSAYGPQIATATVSGPNMTPILMTADNPADGWYQASTLPSQTPQTGDAYSFDIAYTDGTQATLTAAVQWVFTDAPTLTVTQPAGGGLAFTWTDVSAQAPNDAYYQLIVSDLNGNNIWSRNYPLGTLSGAFNDDGNASAQLQSGESYWCYLQISDQYNDWASTPNVMVTLPGVNVQLTVGNDVDPVNGGYSIQMNAYGQTNANGSLITSITVSGPNISTTPMTAGDSYYGYYWLTVSPSQPPQVGDQYTFLVAYADGTQSTLTAAVQGVVTVAPTLTVTQPTGGGLAFSWNDVSAQVPNAAYYQLNVQDQYGNTFWHRQYPLNTLSGAFNDDGSAWEQLQNGETYTCSLYIYDKFGDYAYTSVSVTIPGITVQMTVDNFVDPVNGGYFILINAYGQMNANGSMITSITVSGPNIPTTAVTSVGSYYGWYGVTVESSRPPQVSDLYTFSRHLCRWDANHPDGRAAGSDHRRAHAHRHPACRRRLSVHLDRCLRPGAECELLSAQRSASIWSWHLGAAVPPRAPSPAPSMTMGAHGSSSSQEKPIPAAYLFMINSVIWPVRR